MKKYLQKVNWLYSLGKNKTFYILFLSLLLILCFSKSVLAEETSIDLSLHPIKIFIDQINGLLRPFSNDVDYSNIPTPSPYQDPQAALSVTQLVDAIKYNPACTYAGKTGVISQHNLSCIDSSSQLNISPVAQQYLDECVEPKAKGGEDFEFLQCVCFARAVVAMTTGRVLNRIGKANDYITHPPDGYRFVKKTDLEVQNGTIAPKQGDLLIFDFSELGTANYGHIAYIIAYEGYTENNGEKTFLVDVAEGNVGVRGSVGIRQNISTGRADVAGWLTTN